MLIEFDVKIDYYMKCTNRYEVHYSKLASRTTSKLAPNGEMQNSYNELIIYHPKSYVLIYNNLFYSFFRFT